MVKNGRKWFEMPGKSGIAGHGLTCLEMAAYDQTWLEMAGNGF